MAASPRFRSGFSAFHLIRGDRPLSGAKLGTASLAYRPLKISSLPFISGDAVAGGVIYLLVDDVDSTHQEFVAKGVTIDTGPINQDWGNREM